MKPTPQQLYFNYEHARTLEVQKEVHVNLSKLGLARMHSFAVALPYLTHLDLSHNKLTSIDIPDLVVQCPNIQVLDLSHNEFENLKPLLELRKLTQLQELSLHGNPMYFISKPLIML